MNTFVLRPYREETAQKKVLLYLILLELSLLGLATYMPLTALFFIILVAAVAILFLSLKFPLASLLLLLFSIFLGPLSTISVGGKIPQIFYLDLIFTYVLFILFFKRLLTEMDFHISINSIQLLFFLFLVYCLIPIFLSIDIFRGLASLRGLLFGFAMLAIARYSITDLKMVKALFWILMAWGVCLSGIQLHAMLKQGNILLTVITKNIHLSWGSSNYLAAFYALLIPIGVSCIFTKSLSLLLKLCLIAISLFMITSLFLTGSRGGVIALALGSVILLCRFRNWKSLLAFLFFCLFIAIVISTVPFSSIVWQGIIGYRTSSSVLSRIEIWLESINIFKAHPVFGVGLGNIHHYVENYYIKFASGFYLIKAHNLVLELLAETGIVGMTIFGILLFKTLRIQLSNCLQTEKGFQNSLAWGILSGTMAAIIHSMVEPNILSYMFGLVFWLIIGLSIQQKMLTRPREGR